MTAPPLDKTDSITPHWLLLVDHVGIIPNYNGMGYNTEDHIPSNKKLEEYEIFLEICEFCISAASRSINVRRDEGKMWNLQIFEFLSYMPECKWSQVQPSHDVQALMQLFRTTTPNDNYMSVGTCGLWMGLTHAMLSNLEQQIAVNHVDHYNLLQHHLGLQQCTFFMIVDLVMRRLTCLCWRKHNFISKMKATCTSL